MASTTEKSSVTEVRTSKETLLEAFKLMCTAKTLAEKYEENKEVTSKYVHATSRGHEAIQLACGMQLKPQDWVSPYYRDDSILLGIGITPYELMLQVFAKKAKMKVVMVGTGVGGIGFWGSTVIKNYGDDLEFVGLHDTNQGRMELAKRKFA